MHDFPLAAMNWLLRVASIYGRFTMPMLPLLQLLVNLNVARSYGILVQLFVSAAARQNCVQDFNIYSYFVNILIVINYLNFRYSRTLKRVCL